MSTALLSPPPTATPALPFAPRGPLSTAVRDALTEGAPLRHGRVLAHRAIARAEDVVRDDDVQTALFLLYASAYGAFPALRDDLEWDPALIEVRRVLEAAFEAVLRERVPRPTLPEPGPDAVARALFALAEADAGPSPSRYLAREATTEQALEFLIHRSVYTLREADPHSWAIPRLTGAAKAALVEIQSDEYGGGRPDRVHAELFARTLRGAGLDDVYGAYIDAVPALTLASHNMMSMFGLNRRLLGAIVGHLAAFEMTSSLPNRRYAAGFRRLGYGASVTEYFDEHVEADAVHEQIAARDLAGGLAQDRPDLTADIMFGAAACLAIDRWTAEQLMDAWSAGRSSLRAGWGDV